MSGQMRQNQLIFGFTTLISIVNSIYSKYLSGLCKSSAVAVRMLKKDKEMGISLRDFDRERKIQFSYFLKALLSFATNISIKFISKTFSLIKTKHLIQFSLASRGCYVFKNIILEYQRVGIHKISYSNS